MSLADLAGSAASGMQADTELMLRRSLPGCSPRALAAARILSAADAAELAGRGIEALGRWQEPVSPINEVHIPSLYFILYLQCHC